MNHPSVAALISILCFFGFIIPAKTSASLKRATILRGDDEHIILRTSELRSAYWVRAGVVNYDATNMSPSGVRRQLQRHFDVVLGILMESTPGSVETALYRLQASRGASWSNSERAKWRRFLLIARSIQLQRLKQYRDRGVFPLHEGQADAPTPIFIDDYNTACAVGHLMRLSGWQSDVAAIQRSNNLVYIPHITSGPVAKWVLTSGLTIAEAALIQPAYPNFPSELPSIPAHAVKPLEAEWSGVFDDLRFSNFRFYRHGDTAPSVNATITHSFCNSYACSILPRIEDYSGHVEHMGWFELLPEGFDDFERVVVQFDVETLLPSQRIARSPQGSTAYTRSQGPIFGQRNDVLLFAGDTEDEFFMDDVVHWEYSNPIVFVPINGFVGGLINAESREPASVFDQNDFQPTRRMNVVTELLLRDGQPYQAQLLHFNVVQVPEPSSIISALAALAAIGARRSRKMSCARGR